MAGIANRLYARCGEPVNLETRSDVASGTGGIIETYTTFATAVMAKVVEIGTNYAGNEQIEEGATHLITVFNFPAAEEAQYVLFGDRRMRVLRQRYIGPPDIRFCQFMCEELSKNA